MIQKPRGTVDIFGEYGDDFEFIKEFLINFSRLSNFGRIETPIFENYELFCRDKNDSTDIVKKEMYVFKDKGDRLLALRPEGTAPVIRSVIENKVLFKKPLPLKYFYISPMFRYERPQSGRQRQFHQYGMEVIGCNSIYDEFHSIIFALEILKQLNIRNYTLKINYIGNFESRRKWMEALRTYFLPFKDQLTETSQERLDTNPMRILDDKVDGELDFVKKAPKISEFLSEQERKDIDTFYNSLKQSKVNFEIDDALVRGLDYYTGFVFEIVSNSDKLKGQSTIIGGGKYAKLFKEIGYNEDVECFGFAIGLERLLIAYRDENPDTKTNKTIDVYFASLTEDKQYLFDLLFQLRAKNIACDSNFDINKIDKHFKYAQNLEPKYICIIGNEELKNNVVTVRDQKTFTEQKVKMNEIVDFLSKNI